MERKRLETIWRLMNELEQKNTYSFEASNMVFITKEKGELVKKLFLVHWTLKFFFTSAKLSKHCLSALTKSCSAKMFAMAIFKILFRGFET